MPQRQKEIYTVPADQMLTKKDGQFVLKPTSVNNREKVNQMMEEYRQEILTMAANIKHNQVRDELIARKETGDYEGDIPEAAPDSDFEEFEFYLRLFECCTTGPHDQIDKREFDIQIAEDAKNDFLPEARKMADELLRSLTR